MSDTHVWDYVVTYGGPSLFMTAVFVFVMPIVWFKLARPRFQRWPSRLAVMLAVWMVAWFIAYGDVLLIAREAKRVCEEEAGLRVYRTAEVEGFAGFAGIKEWAAQGFQFVENIGVDGNVTVFRVQDGQFVTEQRKNPISKYQYSSQLISFSDRLSLRRESVTEIATGDVLGELLTFRPRLGWIDGALGNIVGANPNPKLCEGVGMIAPDKKTLSFKNLIHATLIPPN